MEQKFWLFIHTVCIVHCTINLIACMLATGFPEYRRIHASYFWTCMICIIIFNNKGGQCIYCNECLWDSKYSTYHNVTENLFAIFFSIFFSASVLVFPSFFSLPIHLMKSHDYWLLSCFVCFAGFKSLRLLQPRVTPAIAAVQTKQLALSPVRPGRVYGPGNYIVYLFNQVIT